MEEILSNVSNININKEGETSPSLCEVISNNFNIKIEKSPLTLWDKSGQIQHGDLVDALEAYVEEERNGLFELTFDYPNNYPLSDKLEKECIVIANANDTLRNQKFRIYDTQKFLDGTITVFARHTSFDLMYDIVNNVTFTNQSCEYALNQLFRQSQFSTHYRGYSDIINAQDYSMSMCNILEAIGGKQGSIIDTYGTGAEILRDNENIHVLNRRGHDNGVSIEYAKNLTGFELEEDTTDLVTRIIPYAKYTDEENKEVLVKANNVDSPLMSNYSHPYVKYIDYSDKFEQGEVPTTQKLTTLAQNEYRDKKVDIPKQNYKIEFIPLSKCVGYEGIEDKISLCDLVTIKNSQYNINTQAKVIKYKYNVLTDRYESMELGEPKTSLGDIIGGGGGNGEDGKPGPPGPPGPPGEDGNIGDFPDSLPSKSVLTGKSIGLASIELTWTFENKVYYSYELYASKIKDFTPNSFDLIHEGQASSYLYQAKPNETWYFRVCGVNSYGNRNEFSDQISVTTAKINGNDWIESATIGNALIGDLSADKITSGTISGHYIDARNLSVTDGNGKRTLDIDSFGNVNLDVKNLSISSKGVSTVEYVNTAKDQVMANAKTYTDSSILVVNNAIKEKVSQTTYDENNRVVNQKFADVEKNVNGINQTVGEIEGKYVDKTTLEQTKDEFNFKFENSGVGNLVSNPNFRGIWKNWIPDGHTSVYQNNASSDYGRIGVSTNVKNRYVYIKSDTLMVVDGGVDYSFSAWDASDVTPYNVQHPNLSVTINHTVDFLDENKNKISHLDVIKKNHTNGWTDERGKVHAIFKTPSNCRYVNYRHHAIFSGGASNAQLNLYLAYVCISRGYSKGYMPHTNEIYSNVTTIDGNGVEINHINGATSRMDHEAIEFTASNGAKTLRIKDGGLNFHTWQVPAEMVGFIKPTLMEENKSYNGVILSTYGEGDFVGIGNSKSTDENNWVATPSLMIIHHNNVDGYDAGTNFVNNDVFFKTQCNVNHNMAFNQYSGKLIFNNKFSDVNLKHKMFNISSTNEMCIVGKPSLILGYINSSGSPISALKILDTGWGVNDSNWNWNNKALQNANLTYSLEPQSEQLRSMRKAINKAYSQKSIEDRIIRHLCTTETSTGNDTSVMVEIPQLLAENLELDYHVNISKMSFGDYRVVEKTPYYFILESEKPNFRFTYEIVGREVEKAKDIRFISSMPYVELENNLVDNSGYDMSYIDLTESN